MTLVYSANRPAADPQTHAIVIGVNDYPHLNGGSSYAVQPAPQTFGLGQLTSPVVSARELATWLEKKYRNNVAPLGTLELLLSADNQLPAAEPPTFQNISAAFSRWHQRCNQTVDNVAIFYFCGHGLDVHITVLLAEDFGSNPLAQWDSAIDFNLTFTNLADLQAKTQIFLLDACRDQPPNALALAGQLGARPLKGTAPTRMPLRNAPILKAAAIGRKAHAPPNGVSYFTKALIECLDRVGASHFDGTDWVVDSSSLKRGLVQRLARTRGPTGALTPLPCDVGGGICNFDSDLHWIHGQAEVMSRITCDPDAALDHAELIVDDGQGNPRTRLPKAEPWDLDLQAGAHCDIDARLLPAAPYNQVYPWKKRLIYPPKFECKVKVV